MPFLAKFGKKMGYGAKNRFFGVHKVVKIAFFRVWQVWDKKSPSKSLFWPKWGFWGQILVKKGFGAKIRFLRAKNGQFKFWGGLKSDLKNAFFMSLEVNKHDGVEISPEKIAFPP